MDETLELALEKYRFYCHWKASGMLSGKFGNKDAQRRLTEIRALLKPLNLSLKDLQKIVDKNSSSDYIS
jgi:hypothetical protein